MAWPHVVPPLHPCLVARPSATSVRYTALAVCHDGGERCGGDVGTDSVLLCVCVCVCVRAASGTKRKRSRKSSSKGAASTSFFAAVLKGAMK